MSSSSSSPPPPPPPAPAPAAVSSLDVDPCTVPPPRLINLYDFESSNNSSSNGNLTGDDSNISNSRSSSTSTGTIGTYYRSFELWQGDISHPQSQHVNLLVLSTNGGVEDSIYRRYGISLAVCRSSLIEFDFRKDLGVWVSRPLSVFTDDPLPFNRILGIDVFVGGDIYWKEGGPANDDNDDGSTSRDGIVDRRNNTLTEIDVVTYSDSVANLFGALALLEVQMDQKRQKLQRAALRRQQRKQVRPDSADLDFDYDKEIQTLWEQYTIQSISLPLIGMAIVETHHVMRVLLPAAKKAMQRSSTISKILLYGFTKVDSDELDTAMNQVLGRTTSSQNERQANDSGYSPISATATSTTTKSSLSSVHIPTSASDLCHDLAMQLQQSQDVTNRHYHPLLRDFVSVLQRDDVDEIRSWEIGILARRLTEMIVDELLAMNDEMNEQLGNSTDRNVKTGSSRRPMILARRIQQLGNTSGFGDSSGTIPGWFLSYLNVLRSFGNESAHESPPPAPTSQPQSNMDYGSATAPANIINVPIIAATPQLQPTDLILCLLCTQRVHTFWLNQKEQQLRQQNRTHVGVTWA